jgi:hypothetical protein
MPYRKLARAEWRKENKQNTCSFNPSLRRFVIEYDMMSGPASGNEPKNFLTLPLNAVLAQWM